MNAEVSGGTPARAFRRSACPVPLSTLPRLAAGAAACAILLALPAVPSAQEADPEPLANDTRSMTVEELERYIAERKAQLEQVRENRDITAEKARRVREELARKAAERRARTAELEALCREREALVPGSLEDCLARVDGEPDR